MVRLKAALQGKLDEQIKATRKHARRSVKSGVRDVTTDLKNEMRRQVRQSGMSQRLANTWRGNIYPKNKDSMRAAGLVYTRAQDIMRSFEFALTIRGKEKRFLALPTANAPKRGTDGKRIQPSNFPEQRFGKLRYVKRPGKPALLVADNVRGSFRRKDNKLRGFRPASATARRTGRGLATAVMFTLVPVVKMPRKIRFFKAATKAHRRLPALIRRYWEK